MGITGRVAAIGSGLAALACGGAMLHAQPAPPAPAADAAPSGEEAFDPVLAKQIVEKLATALEENFVRPETGSAYAAAVRAKAASGAYAHFPSAKSFAEAVTADLQAVAPDRHLRLFPPHALNLGGAGGGPPPGSSIVKSGWVGDGIAYISFRAFFGDEKTLTDLRKFLADHAAASSLIIDAREHRGGGLAEIDLLFAQLFAQETELVRMDTRLAIEQRGEEAFGDGPTLKRLQGPPTVVRRAHVALPDPHGSTLAKARVFLLTSGRTASAAEHLALSLKRTHRALLIGETTRGAGNYGHTVDLGGGYGAFIPFGRTFDPDTGEGWEGVGVKPDVEVPADKALDEAIRRASSPASAL
ncbi:S41 family peptidase [Sphingosinicella rhizophila]|uniref:S41 family peptidase n=1 Tax=Sphingosinicella rhizophila TaxID=3050082 RepID=A0ABU3Q9W5_9SPHN|nr:S41 family peptidase [Sphingosinicella sp. GR2756]MDT9600166.1 S41 family peptidase [Sphingosinicella sp. GR2756]